MSDVEWSNEENVRKAEKMGIKVDQISQEVTTAIEEVLARYELPPHRSMYHLILDDTEILGDNGPCHILLAEGFDGPMEIVKALLNAVTRTTEANGGTVDLNIVDISQEPEEPTDINFWKGLRPPDDMPPAA